jgi:hypothetical protein
VLDEPGVVFIKSYPLTFGGHIYNAVRVCGVESGDHRAFDATVPIFELEATINVKDA